MIDWTGPRRQECPQCGRGPKDRACGVTIDDRGGVAHCHRCGYVEMRRGESIAHRPGGPVAPRSEPVRHQVLSEFGRMLWSACQKIAGEALAYLEARCCVTPPADGDLRWHPALHHPPSGLVGPALVALGTDAVTGRSLTLHRTWIRADGRKAPVTPARMLLAGHRKQGAVCRLWPDEAVTTGLAVAEGLESALSIAHAFQPAWCCFDASNLAALPVLDGVDALTVAADNDTAGIAAAETCAQRWADSGRQARIVMTPTPGTDINDVAMEAG